MKKKNSLFLCVVALVATSLFSGKAWANEIDITLTQTVVAGAAGSTIMFDATVMNTSASTIFLNASGGSTVSPMLTLDGSPFLLNAPLSLAAGASSGPFNIFDVMIASGTPLGLYNLNTFTILGGLTPTSFSLVGSTNFGVQVNAASEPPSVWLLLGSAVLGLALLQKVLKENDIFGR